MIAFYCFPYTHPSYDKRKQHQHISKKLKPASYAVSRVLGQIVWTEDAENINEGPLGSRGTASHSVCQITEMGSGRGIAICIQTIRQITKALLCSDDVNIHVTSFFQRVDVLLLDAGLCEFDHLELNQ